MNIIERVCEILDENPQKYSISKNSSNKKCIMSYDKSKEGVTVIKENSRWFMNNKLQELKYYSNNKLCKIISDKELMKLAGVKMDLSFNRKKFYDANSNLIPNQKITFHEKVIEAMKKRLNESVLGTVDRLSKVYEIDKPLLISFSRVVKYLAQIHKKYKKNKRKINISYNLSKIVDKIKGGDKFFSYNLDKKTVLEIPVDIKSLMKKILNDLNKSNIPKGIWIEPIIKKMKKQRIDVQSIKEKMDEEKVKLNDNLKNKKNIDVTMEYVYTILKMETYVIDYLEYLENDYSTQATNIDEILKSLKLYFSSLE